MKQHIEATRVLFVCLAVLSLWVIAITIGYLVIITFHRPQRLGFPFWTRMIGLLMVLSSVLMFGWLIRYRKPLDILNSTYVTFSKIVGRARLEERLGRTEPLVVQGPYRYVRHPLYSAVLLLAVGLWLLFDYSALLVTTLLLLLWLNFVVIPFEERELRAIFGHNYEEYASKVHRILPIRPPFQQFRRRPRGKSSRKRA
jgi:isoprenylcysteine carboxyl methyltransferase (ICMT) family protein YpbQ